LKHIKPNTETLLDSASCCTTCNEQTKATWYYGVPWLAGVIGNGVVQITQIAWLGGPLQAISCVAFFMQCNVRGKIRETLGLEQDCCNDCCVSMFCYSCALVQEQNELKSRNLLRSENGNGLYIGNITNNMN
jgi:Cys-rich protein (TIGR01571 family)